MLDQTPELAAVLSRLERVEKENRRMKQAALGILVIVGSMFLMAQAKHSTDKVIEAERFVVRDSNGKIRAAFGMEDADPSGATLAIGSAGLTVAEEEEEHPVYLHGGDMAWLLLSSRSSTEALNARVGTSDLPSPQLSLIDKKGYRTDIGRRGC